MASLGNVHERIAANLRELGEDESAVERIQPSPDLAATVRDADFVVEAVLEDLPLKRQLFDAIERAARPDAVLASNTSVIPISKIMGGLKHKSRALGTHWWNPPYLVPLVEVIGTRWTSPAAIDRTIALHAGAGKTPVHVKKDVPGFVGNRLQHALWREAVSLVENGICDAETVDTVIKASFGRRLAVLGPLENADLVGTDLTLAIHKTVLPAIDGRAGPSPYLKALVKSGKLGFKSGEGFRPWLLVFYLVPTVLSWISAILSRDGIGFLFALGSLAISIWALVELGCLRGTVGPNRYGEDPLAPAP
jgi:3-hydroxybutyryl-CoA dehydrogenase